MKPSKSSKISSREFNADPQTALSFLRKLGRIWTVWPLDENANLVKKIYHEIFLWFIIINLFITSIGLWTSVCNCYKYPILMAKNLSQLMIVSDSFSHLMLYRLNRSDLRTLIQQIFDCMKNCKRYEKFVMKEHYNRLLWYYITVIILYISAALVFFCGAIILKKRFPVDASYPFSTDSVLVSTIIYIHQTFSIVQNSVIIMIDLMIITLFWYAGARLKILGYRLQSMRCDEMLKQCIIEHQNIIRILQAAKYLLPYRYIQHTVFTVRLITYKTITIVGLVLISAGLQLLHYDAKTVMSQFTLIIIVASFRIITICSTIEEMKNLNENLRWTIYKSDWIEDSSKIKQNLLIFTQRCQIPLVTVNGRMLNTMSLKFFAQFIYMTMSHITTLRAIIERST